MQIDKAVVPVSNIEYSYGFGVYETIRVSNNVIYFLEDHSQRLIDSAQIISLEHSFSESFVRQSIQELVKKSDAGTYNLKLLLIGGPTKSEASLYILCLSPFFPDRKLYKNGASFITYNYERAFPHAKTLNMLQSYMAYRKARENNSYDALLVNRRGYITEGSRTNFFCVNKNKIVSPLEDDILLGVMRKVVLKVAIQNGIEIICKDIRPSDIKNYEAAFVTSTSSKIIPVKSIDNVPIGPLSPTLEMLINKCNQFLSSCSDGKMC